MTLSIQYFVQILEMNNIDKILSLMGQSDIYFPDFGFYYGQLKYDSETFDRHDILLDDSYVLDPKYILIQNSIKSSNLIYPIQQLIYDRFHHMKNNIMIGPTLKCIVQPDSSHNLTIKGLMLTEFLLTINNNPHNIILSNGSRQQLTFQQLTEHGPFDFKPFFHMTRPDNMNLQLKIGVTGSQLGFYADYHMKPRLLTREDCIQIGGNLRYHHILVDSPPPYFTIRRNDQNIEYTFPEIDMKQIRLPSLYGFYEYINDISIFIIYDLDGQFNRAYKCIDNDGPWRWELISESDLNNIYNEANYI